jgi:hypothetical protein
LQGEFLKDREFEKNKEMADRVISKMLELDPGAEYYILRKPVDIGWLFNNLLHFRQDVFKVTYPNKGMDEGYSAGLYYSFYLQGQLKEIIKNNLSEIDETLWLILDPEKRDLGKAEINYPEADLDRIDLEWAMENY